MKQNYFEYNGKKYYTGTVFITRDNMWIETEASFICYDTDHEEYIFNIRGCRYRDRGEVFWKRFIAVTDKVNNNVRMPVTKTMKDMQIEGLFIGWVWYVFLMLVSTIFNDAIGLWIFISVVFFSWRAKKIKEEGTYIEW